ncbi:hypothetical protein QFC19_002554 [Naganishia cerealis]|uniref:Uncharacterized protein n=1 Tax=Naganishia cerealis TaxID=610337 RepID=A0ACC2WA57_9TREE|nr:hypothetical protein QFC19_002554 [Naganishia cerealis]
MADPPFSPTNESELFLDVARLTSLQVEKDRALSRAQEARDRGLATESVGSQRIRTDAAHRSRIRDSVARANATIHPEAAPVEPEIVSAMASFGISYEGNRRPSIDNSLDPLTKSDSKEQRSVERQRRKRMNRQLEHEKVIRETPMSEYS